MRRLPNKRPILTVLGAAGALCLAAFAVVALANVTIYKNDFSSKGEAKEMKLGEGDKCVAEWSKHSEALKVKVKKGPDTCGYRPPVQGDDSQPDHDFRAKLKISKQTPTKLRDDA